MTSRHSVGSGIWATLTHSLHKIGSNFPDFCPLSFIYSKSDTLFAAVLGWSERNRCALC
nr:hypothetical protein PFCWREHM_PFCWREHM_CDS_0011 [Microvirus sp.]